MAYRLDPVGGCALASVTNLVALAKQSLTQNVIDGHLMFDHMNRFFTHHRAYIFGLAWSIKRHATDPTFKCKAVPLPFFDGRMPLPSAFKFRPLDSSLKTGGLKWCSAGVRITRVARAR